MSGSGRNTELLINLIKPNSCLYDTMHDDYKNIQLKESIWAKIAKELNKDVNQVKSDWKKIRDCHRDAVKRRRLLSNIKDPSTIKKWKYEDHMEFLLDFMTTRRREPYFENNVASTSDNDNEDFVVLTEPTLGDPSSNSETDYVPVSLPKLNQNSSCLPKSSHLSKQHNDSLSEDALDFFFNSMCATTKRLPLKYQLQIKKEIFEIVTRNEETAFQCDNSS